MKYTLDISNDSHLLRTNLNSIPKNCTELIVTGELLEIRMYEGKQVVFGDSNFSLYRLNEKLKTCKELEIVDFSKCLDITKICSSFSNLSVKK